MTKKDEICALLHNFAPLQISEIATTLGLDIGNTSKHIKALEKEGEVVTMKEGRKKFVILSSDNNNNNNKQQMLLNDSNTKTAEIDAESLLSPDFYDELAANQLHETTTNTTIVNNNNNNKQQSTSDYNNNPAYPPLPARRPLNFREVLLDPDPFFEYLQTLDPEKSYWAKRYQKYPTMTTKARMTELLRLVYRFLA